MPPGLIDALERLCGVRVRVTLAESHPRAEGKSSRRIMGQLSRGGRQQFLVDGRAVSPLSTVTKIERRWARPQGGANYRVDWSA